MCAMCSLRSMRSLGRSFNAYQKMPSVVENRGPTRMQMPATVPVCADEHIKQTTVYPANLRRQTPRIDPLGFHEISTPVVTSSEF